MLKTESKISNAEAVEWPKWLIRLMILTATTGVFGIFFVSGVYFYPMAQDIYKLYIFLFYWIVIVLLGIKFYKKLDSDSGFRKNHWENHKFPNALKPYWKVYQITGLIIGATMFAFAFASFGSLLVVNKITAVNDFEQIVTLTDVGVYNRSRRKHLLPIYIATEKLPEPIEVDVDRDGFFFQNYSTAQERVANINQLICIKGKQSIFGFIINEVRPPPDCKSNDKGLPTDIKSGVHDLIINKMKTVGRVQNKSPSDNR